MPFKITGRVEGLADVLSALDGVSKKIKRKGIRKGVNVAGKIVLRAAKAKVPNKSGLLKRSLGRKVKVYRSTGVAVAVVGPRVGFKQEVARGGATVLSNPTKYAHLVEGGTSRSQAFPFLRPALESSKAEVREAMANAIREVLEASS